MFMEKSKPETWRKIRPGSSFVLTDEQTVCELLKNKAKGAVNGITLKVTEICDIQEQNNLCHWRLFGCETEGEKRYVLVKSVDKALDVRLYYPVTWLPEAPRKELVDAGNCFMFAPPANVNNFKPVDLEMAESFDLDFGQKKVSFNRKTPTLYAEAIATPDESGMGKNFTQVTEYLATEQHETPELIFFEFGGLNDRGRKIPEGGWMRFLEGYSINLTDIDILSV
jgi:hypothetical protein